jgi:hypothetical protein
MELWIREWATTRVQKPMFERGIQRMRMKRRGLLLCAVLLAAIGSCRSLRADGTSWTFKTETVDSATRFTSLATDAQGNVHLAYVTPGDRVFYGFRDVRTAKWFTTELDGRASFTSLSLDSHGNPSICYTQQGMHYAHWGGTDWQKEQIAPGAGTIAYYCSVAVSPDGVPRVTWYQERTPQDTNYLHMRYAYLDNGEWLVKTIDWDAQTGKWNAMALDKKGMPHLSFDAFVSGQLKYAFWDGKTWIVQAVDARRDSQQPGRGMGNSLVLDTNGRPMISYFEEAAFKFAKQKNDGTWSIETLASTNPSGTWAGYRSSQALDNQGLPHLVYEDGGMLRHMYWDGKIWHTQIIAHPGAQRLRFASIAISNDNTIYISYCDGDDGSLKVSVGRPSATTANNEAEKKSNH